MRRTLFIGDVHGCNDELGDLLKVAGWTTEDRLVLVGDLVAKGPDSAGVVQRLDKDTTGALVFTRTIQAKRALDDQIRAHMNPANLAGATGATWPCGRAVSARPWCRRVQSRAHWSSLSAARLPLPVGAGMFSLHCRLPLMRFRFSTVPP